MSIAPVAISSLAKRVSLVCANRWQVIFSIVHTIHLYRLHLFEQKINEIKKKKEKRLNWCDLVMNITRKMGPKETKKNDNILRNVLSTLLNAFRSCIRSLWGYVWSKYKIGINTNRMIHSPYMCIILVTSMDESERFNLRMINRRSKKKMKNFIFFSISIFDLLLLRIYHFWLLRLLVKTCE